MGNHGIGCVDAKLKGVKATWLEVSGCWTAMFVHTSSLHPDGDCSIQSKSRQVIFQAQVHNR